LYPGLIRFTLLLAANVGRSHSICSTEYYCFGFYGLSFCILKGIVLLFDYIKIKKQLPMKTILIYCISQLVSQFSLSLFLFCWHNVVCPGTKKREKEEGQ
jgi:hypothetical protein